MLSGANAFEIYGIEEHEAEASPVRRLKCNKVILRWNSPLFSIRQGTGNCSYHVEDLGTGAFMIVLLLELALSYIGRLA
jgi:hypothetical protein